MGTIHLPRVIAGQGESPARPPLGSVSGADVALEGLQMKGLETIFASRRNGRGPDSSLKRLWIFVWIRVYEA